MTQSNLAQTATSLPEPHIRGTRRDQRNPAGEPLILVTNDDGIHSPCLHASVKAV